MTAKNVESEEEFEKNDKKPTSRDKFGRGMRLYGIIGGNADFPAGRYAAANGFFIYLWTRRRGA